MQLFYVKWLILRIASTTKDKAMPLFCDNICFEHTSTESKSSHGKSYIVFQLFMTYIFLAVDFIKYIYRIHDLFIVSNFEPQSTVVVNIRSLFNLLRCESNFSKGIIDREIWSFKKDDCDYIHFFKMMKVYQGECSRN